MGCEELCKGCVNEPNEATMAGLNFLHLSQAIENIYLHFKSLLATACLCSDAFMQD